MLSAGPSMPFSYLIGPLLLGLVLAFLAWSAGARWAAASRVAGSAAGEWGLATALGLTLLGFGGYALGALGALRPAPVAGLAVALALPGASVVARRCAALRPPGLGGWAVIGVALVGIALALYPPLPFDETLYHLPMARVFARSGALPFLPDLRVPVFPALFEVLAAQLLLFDGDLAVHLVSWLSVAASAALVVDWGARRGDPLAGRWAAALYVGSPLVAYLAGTAYVEPLLALLATAALSALDARRRQPTAGAALVAALLAGACAATKYLGLAVVAIVLVELALAAVRERRRRQAAVAAALLFATLALPYGRILWFTGNPLFPFATSVFGSNAWSYQVFEPGLATRLVDWLRAPFDAVFARARVGGQPPISPAFLLGLPVVALAGSRWSRAVLVAVALYASALPVHVRYLLPAAPILALAVATDCVAWRRGAWPTRGVWRAWTTALLLLPSLAWAGYRVVRLGPPPADDARRTVFLAARVPGYSALAFLNRSRGSAYVAYVAYGEQLRDYAQGRFLGDLSVPWSYGAVLSAADPTDLYARLRRAGADYLVVPTTPVAAPVEALARSSPRFREVFRDSTAAVYALQTEAR